MKRSLSHRKNLHRAVPLLVFAVALLTYWMTAEPAASLWDCPEYLTNALLLEIGHPPGNPFWALTHRVISILPLGIYQPLLINLAAGLFSALAAALGSIIALTILRFVFSDKHPVVNAVAATCGTLIFAWCDSVWFSAVEAEVYAMSLFLTVLTLYISVRARLTFSRTGRARLIILIAYLSGLSLGVHQLNLLVLPVIAIIIFCPAKRKKVAWRAFGLFCAGCAVVILMLKGLLHGSLFIASQFELTAVNTLGLPLHSGVLIWAACALILSFTVAGAAASANRLITAILATCAFAISGLTFIATDSPFGICISVIISIAAGIAVFTLINRHRFGVQCALWCLPLVLIGFSCYALIMIRANAYPPMNQGEPVDIFSFMNYLDRKQYGSRPLFYGKTPFSRMLPEETISVSAQGDTTYSYNRVARKVKGRKYHLLTPDAKYSPRTGLRTGSDSLFNLNVENQRKNGYIVVDRDYELIYTPELDMFFPRIVAGDPASMAAYTPWTGMTTDNMQRVQVSVAVDSLGRPIKKRHSDKSPEPTTALRPTYLQHLSMLGGYQLGYMYFRYLFWNFGGRQNDVNTTGEAEHGNFITGIGVIDNLMLGDQEKLPAEIHKENAGRNVLYFIPFLFGVWGIIALCRRGTRGKRICFLIALLFLLTGPAIAFYLNQNIGEPRDRDYSFLGSFFAYTLWITAGFAAAANGRSRLRRVLGLTVAVAVAVWVLVVNINDHDRCGRTITEDYARMILESCPENTILFVYGDNYTFPLWYAQEVMGVRRDITVVSLPYLSTDWYASQLSEPLRHDNRGLRMFGKRRDFAYGRYAIVRLGNDTVEVDAESALREMYDMTDSREPMLKSVVLRLGNGIRYDMRSRLGKYPGGYLTAKEIVLLDIIAGETAVCVDARPIAWIKNVGADKYSGFYDDTREDIFIRVLRSPDDSNESVDSLPPLPTLRFGGADRGAYIDDPSRRMMRFMHRNLLLHADRLDEAGKHNEAAALRDTLKTGMPYGAKASDSIP